MSVPFVVSLDRLRGMALHGFPDVSRLKPLPLREQAQLRNEWIRTRLNTVVPRLMERADIAMWIIIAREYNEDPVFATMAPTEWLSARRRTILVFSRRGDGEVTRTAVARYAVGDFFEAAWDPAVEPDQWACLARVIREQDPKNIAVNMSKSFAHADGLAATDRDDLFAALPSGYLESRVVSAEPLAVGWLETRIPEEMEVYPGLCRLAREIIHEGLSREVIMPGKTTTADLVWWYREKIRALGFHAWFHPTVELQRALPADKDRAFQDKHKEEVIQPGDLVHVDLGIVYMGLHTDTQQHAYVLLPGESEAPEGLRAAMSACNRVQDLLLEEFHPGRTGNEVLAAARRRAMEAGLRPSIYTHPLGVHGHAAGATVGLWDQQDGVSGSGDYRVWADTAWSIELNTQCHVSEWGRDVLIMLEEDAYLGPEGMKYIDGRQTSLVLL